MQFELGRASHVGPSRGKKWCGSGFGSADASLLADAGSFRVFESWTGIRESTSLTTKLLAGP